MKAIKTRTAAIVLATAAVLLGGCQDKNTASGSPSASPAWETPASAKPADATSAAAAADNGVAKLSATQILTKAKAALTGAKSFRVAGSGADSGEKAALDLKIDGKNEVGSITTGKLTIEVLRVGGVSYIKANDAYWQQGAGSAAKAKAVEQLIGDRWMKVPSSNKDFASLFSMFSADSMLTPDGKVTKGAAKTFGGQPAITLKDSSKDGFGSLYVATTGKPYPLGSDSADGTVKFSDFGQTFSDLKQPASSDVIDFSAITG